MTQEELGRILKDHKLWLCDSETGCRADLYGADLRGADLDFSAWPLWCGSFGVKCDRALVEQLAGHIAALDVQDANEETVKFVTACRDFARDWKHKPDKWPGEEA